MDDARAASDGSSGLAEGDGIEAREPVIHALDSSRAEEERSQALAPTIARLLLQGPAAPIREREIAPDILPQVRALLHQGDGHLYAAGWREHREELLRIAARDGIRPPGDSRYFFGEACAQRVEAQAAQQQQHRDRQPPVEARLDLPRTDRTRIDRTTAVRPGDPTHAIHEAGHACVGLANGFAVAYCEPRLDLRDPSMGRVLLEPQPGALAYAFVVALLAGGEAERRAFGYIERGHDGGDLEMARAELARIFQIDAADPEIDEWLAEARLDARAEVEQHWSWILRTARLLRHHRRLDQPMIEALRGDARTTNERSTP